MEQTVAGLDCDGSSGGRDITCDAVSQLYGVFVLILGNLISRPKTIELSMQFGQCEFPFFEGLCLAAFVSKEETRIMQTRNANEV